MPTDAAGNEIAELIDEHVKPMGFKKVGSSWLRRSPETVTKLTLQKSGLQYYFDMRVSVLKLCGPDGAEPIWHLIGRMFSPDVSEKVEWEKCLNVRHASVGGKPRLVRLVEILDKRIIPLIGAFGSLEGIKKALWDGQLRGMGVRTELQELTGWYA